MLICDPHAGTIVSASMAAARFLGRDDLSGRSLAEILPEGTLQARLREVAELTTDCARDSEWTFVGSDGQQVAVPVTLAHAGDRCMIAIQASEISSIRRGVDEALRRSEASFRAVIEHLPQAVFVRSSDVILYANGACARLLGHESTADIIGVSPLAFSPKYNHAAVKQRMSMVDVTGRATRRESEWRRRDGSIVPVEVDALGIEYRGEPAVLVSARDLTERRAMVARTAAADRMLALTTLAAGVTHEINGPLAYLVTNLAILVDEVPRLRAPEEAPPGGRTHADLELLLRDAHHGALRVRDVVRDLRLLARPVEEANAHCDLGDVLTSCAKISWRELDGRARVVTDIGEIRPVRGSASRLAQVFTNLLVNAAQAISPLRPEDNEIRITAREMNTGNALVEVSDTGAGIPPELVARIFEPFFTTKTAGVGTGLGLAICESVIASVGGTIHVESELGRGTKFSVVLPLAPARTEVAPGATPSKSRGRILVVDDDPAFASSLRMLLDEHDVLAFTSASLALDQVRADSSFDLVLCDLSMPVLDGMQLHARITEIAPSLADRMIFVTGGPLTAEAQAFLGQIPNRMLEKPFDPAALTALVSDLVSARS